MQRSLFGAGTCSFRSSRPSAISRTCRRHFHDPKPLPPQDEWRAHFPSSFVDVRDRVSINNLETGRLLADSFLSGKSLGAGENKVVIEAYPGPGALSRALLRLPKSKIRKLIILESWDRYYQYLKPLEAVDPRVTVLPIDGYTWDSYSVIEEKGLLDDVMKHDWNAGIHPELHFIAQLPHGVYGEQFFSQLFRCMPTKSWLFKYGRVPMSLVLSQPMWDRGTAPYATNARCKVSVIAEATSQLQNAVRPSELQPYDDHFHPSTSRVVSKKAESKRAGQPHVAVNVVPHQDQLIRSDQLDHWDYVLRRLFVLKSTPLKNAMNSLAPGAPTLLKVLTDPELPPEERVNINDKIKNLTIKDWALIVRAFYNWPFSPEDLTFSNAEDFGPGREG